MEQHPIPQQISSYEFKLIGDMTLKQFLKAAIGIILAIAINSNQLISGQNIELSNDDIKKFIIQNSHLLIEPIRNIKSLSDKKIVVVFLN